MNYKIGQVTLIGFSMQEGRAILHGSFPQELGNGYILKQPIARVKDLPVEQSPRSSPVAVYKWVIVSEPKVQDNAANHWMNKKTRRFRVSKVTHGFQTR